MGQLKKIKRVACAVLCVALTATAAVLVIGATVPADVAMPKQMNVIVDGKSSALNAYNIDGSNFFKLRDLAWIFSGTGKQFDLVWNEHSAIIELLLGHQYPLITPETEVLPDSKKISIVQYLTIAIGTNETNIMSANIDNLNYCKIRDFAAMLDIEIEYDAKTDSILLSTKQSVGLLMPAIDYGFGQIESFETKDTDGHTVTNEIFKEKPITFINLWATWCGPCRSELKDFQAMYDKYQDMVKFITIVDDAIDNKTTADQLIKTYLSDYLNLLPASKLVDPISTGYVPTSVIVNSEGYLVIDKIIGAVGQYDTYLDEALDKIGSDS
jgi:thiol-disulfide isomerase/thioredoxin